VSEEDAPLRQSVPLEGRHQRSAETDSAADIVSSASLFDSSSRKPDSEAFVTPDRGSHQKERGVPDALQECAKRYLTRVIASSGAKVIVPLRNVFLPATGVY
jgi:hypothetical protein